MDSSWIGRGHLSDIGMGGGQGLIETVIRLRQLDQIEGLTKDLIISFFWTYHYYYMILYDTI